MRIDARISDVYAGQQARLQNVGSAGASFSDAMDAAQANYSEKVDFTNMTCKELFGWVNDQISSGKMTLAESHPFLILSLRGNGPEDTQDTRYNFIQKALGRIQFALSNHDEKSVKMWEECLLTMQKVMSETE